MKRYLVILSDDGEVCRYEFGRFSDVRNLLGMCAVTGCTLHEFRRQDGKPFTDAERQVFPDWMHDRRMALDYDRRSVRIVVGESVGKLEYFPPL